MVLASDEQVDRKTFYLADKDPADLFDMAEEIRRQAGARRIRRIPLLVARGGALTGDVLTRFGWKRFPLTSFRLNNILTEYVFDMTPTVRVAGPQPFQLREGVERTLSWLKHGRA
jgi:uncharacterized protein YbjT (DUF2867 family)